ncbi:hypothetical protein BX600DRAFT_432419 [Xylariales sp. PMI_506]|nr:hypothetical protein BX600DRAFT_432419 [Xylariales sp. PMI_506]
MASGNLGFDVNPNGTRLVILQVVFLVLAWIVCSLRAYVKIFITRKIMADDWIMFLALMLYTAYGIIVVVGVTGGGTGKHTIELSPAGIIIALKSWYLCEVLYSPLAALVRTSIAIFLLHLAVQPWHIWVIRINLAVIWVVSIVYFFLMALQCIPASFFWEGAAQVPGATGSCMNHDVVPIATIIHSSLSGISDWILGLLPVAILWKVKINRRTKLSIAVLLSMGLIAGATLMVRIPLVKRIAISADFLYDTIALASWSVIEPSLGIIAGCMASIRPLFKAFNIGLHRSRREGSRRLFSRSPRNGTDKSKSVRAARDISASEVELHSTKNESKKQRSALSKSSAWDVEANHSDEISESSNQINVFTRFEVISERESRASNCSSSNSLADTLSQEDGSLKLPPVAHIR